MHRSPSRLVTGMSLMVLALGACASAGGSGPRRSANLITAEELEATTELYVRGAIQRLRPNWLRERSATSVAALDEPEGRYPTIRVDGAPRPGGLDELGSMDVNDVVEIRYMSPSDATTMYGTGYAYGVIEITTRFVIPPGGAP